MQLTLLAFALIIAVVTAKCANGNSAIKTNGPLCKCKQYQDQGVCCPDSRANGYTTPKDAGQSQQGAGNGACTKPTNIGPGFPCKNANSKCFELIELGKCAYQCSPDQEKYFDSDKSEYRVCKDFATRIWDACKDQEFFSKDKWECKKLSTNFDNATQFVTAKFSDVTVSIQDKTDDKCVNAASATAPAAFVTLAAVGAAFGVRNPLFITLLLVALSTMSVSAKCGSITERDAIKVEAMARCEWYKSETCCVTAAAQNVAVAFPTKEFTGIPKPATYEVKSVCAPMKAECLDALNFVSCISCSGKAREIGNRVCDDQAKKIYDACKDEETFDAAKDEFKCKPIKDVYDNSSVLLTHLGYTQNDDKDCWNSSAAVFFSAAVALLGLALF